MIEKLTIRKVAVKHASWAWPDGNDFIASNNSSCSSSGTWQWEMLYSTLLQSNWSWLLCFMNIIITSASLPNYTYPLNCSQSIADQSGLQVAIKWGLGMAVKVFSTRLIQTFQVMLKKNLTKNKNNWLRVI